MMPVLAPLVLTSSVTILARSPCRIGWSGFSLWWNSTCRMTKRVPLSASCTTANLSEQVGSSWHGCATKQPSGYRCRCE